MTEIARFLRISRQRANYLATLADFPEPIAHLTVGRVWRTADVTAWAAKHGRPAPEDEPDAEEP